MRSLHCIVLYSMSCMESRWCRRLSPLILTFVNQCGFAIFVLEHGTRNTEFHLGKSVKHPKTNKLMHKCINKWDVMRWDEVRVFAKAGFFCVSVQYHWDYPSYIQTHTHTHWATFSNPFIEIFKRLNNHRVLSYIHDECEMLLDFLIKDSNQWSRRRRRFNLDLTQSLFLHIIPCSIF